MSSYLKFLSRNKLYTIIEAIGLAVSLAFVIIIGSYAWQQYSITRESPDRKNIYCFGMPGYLGLTYAFVDEVSDRVPEVELAVRYCNEANPPSMLVEGEEVEVSCAAVSKEFFTMFPYFKFVEGGKVFGGTVGSETWRTVKEYMILVAVACVIGVPIAVWAARRYLEGFIVKLENYGWVFVLAVVISLLMAFGSVLWQTLRAARTNPVDVLQKE